VIPNAHHGGPGDKAAFSQAPPWGGADGMAFFGFSFGGCDSAALPPALWGGGRRGTNKQLITASVLGALIGISAVTSVSAGV